MKVYGAADIKLNLILKSTLGVDYQWVIHFVGKTSRLSLAVPELGGDQNSF
jgi:hypothetical protein